MIEPLKIKLPSLAQRALLPLQTFPIALLPRHPPSAAVNYFDLGRVNFEDTV